MSESGRQPSADDPFGLWGAPPPKPAARAPKPVPADTADHLLEEFTVASAASSPPKMAHVHSPSGDLLNGFGGTKGARCA